MVAEWACDDDRGGVLAAAVCAAEDGGAAVSRCGGFAVACGVSLAGGKAEGCAGDCDRARAGGLLRFELRAGGCGEGISTGISRGATESEKLRRFGKVYSHAIQLRDERGLYRGFRGIDGRGRGHPRFLFRVFHGWEFGGENCH